MVVHIDYKKMASAPQELTSVRSKIPVFKSPRHKKSKELIKNNIVCSTPVNVNKKNLFGDKNQQMSPIRNPSSASSDAGELKMTEKEKDPDINVKARTEQNNEDIQQSIYPYPLVRNITKLKMVVCDSEEEIFPIKSKRKKEPIKQNKSINKNNETIENIEMTGTRSKLKNLISENIDKTTPVDEKSNKLVKKTQFSSQKSKKLKNTSKENLKNDSGIDHKIRIKIKDIKNTINCNTKTSVLSKRTRSNTKIENSASLTKSTRKNKISNSVPSPVINNSNDKLSSKVIDDNIPDNNFRTPNDIPDTISTINFNRTSEISLKDGKKSQISEKNLINYNTKNEGLSNTIINFTKSKTKNQLNSGNLINKKEESFIKENIKKLTQKTENSRTRKSERKRMPSCKYWTNIKKDVNLEEPTLVKKIPSKTVKNKKITNVSKENDDKDRKTNEEDSNLTKIINNEKDDKLSSKSVKKNRSIKQKKSDRYKVPTGGKIRKSLLIEKRMSSPRKKYNKKQIHTTNAKISEQNASYTTEEENDVPRDTLLNNEVNSSQGLKRKFKNNFELNQPKKVRIDSEQKYDFKEMAILADISPARAGGLADVQIDGKRCLLSCFGKFPRELNSNNQNTTVSVGLSITNEFITTGILEIEPAGRKKYEYAKKVDLLFVMLEGTAEVGIGNSSQVLRLGQDFYVPRDTPYYILNLSNSDKVLLYFSKLSNK